MFPGKFRMIYSLWFWVVWHNAKLFFQRRCSRTRQEYVTWAILSTMEKNKVFTSIKKEGVFCLLF
jgi:hypothetical protein